MTARRYILRLLPFALVALCVILLRQKLPATAVALHDARPIAFASLGLFFVWNHLATLAWRVLLRASGAHPFSIGRLVRLRIEAQAVNQLVPAAGLAGEALRAVGAAGPDEVGATSLATVLDNVAGAVSGIAFALFAIALHLQKGTGRPELVTLAITAAPAMALLLVAVAVPFHLAPRWVSHAERPGVVHQLIGAFANNRREIRRAFREAVGLRFLERILSAGEVFVTFVAVGAHVSASDAALISAVFILVSLSVFFVPGQLGAAEAAVAMTSALIGVPAALGLSAALLRRARQLAVCALGVILLLARKWRTPAIGATVSTEQAQ